MSTTKGQHRGHCQVCGRIQVIDGHTYKSGGLSKHGYVVPNGYFKGVCQGSGELPLQQSRAITDAIIKALIESAQRNEVHALAMHAGMLKPERALKLTAWGSRVHTPTGSGGKRQPVLLRWSDANETERSQQIILETGEAESNARFAHGHALRLTTLAYRVHNTALIDRDAEELATRTARQAKTAPIAGAYRTKAAQQADLAVLSLTYSKLRRDIQDTYLKKRDVATEMLYYALPHELHQWRTQHSRLVLDAYPEHKPQVDAIEVLVINRNEIKSRPVIK